MQNEIDTIPAGVLNTEPLQHKALDIKRQAEALAVTNQEQNEAAAGWLKTWKSIQAEIDDKFDPVISQAFQAHRKMVALKKQIEAPYKEGMEIVKRKVGDYLRLVEAQRREAERKAQEEARKLEEERRLEEALALEAEGNQKDMEAVLEAPIEAPVVVIPEQEKPQGISTRQNWTFRIENENAIPREYMTPDLKKIGAVVRGMKDKAKIPGVLVYSEESVIVRS